MSAVSESEYGLLESDLTTVVITRNMGEGAQVVHLVVRLKLPGRFLVSSYQAGEKAAAHLAGETMVRRIFIGCQIGQAMVQKNEEHVQASVNICHIVFSVEVLLNSTNVVAYFKERWGDERIMRPASTLEQKKLGRRLNIFSEETFCDQNVFLSGWSVSVQER